MMTFETKKACNDYLMSIGLEKMENGNFYRSGRYELAHNEYDRPEYKAVRYPSKGGWMVKKINFFYPGNRPYIKEDGPVELLKEGDFIEEIDHYDDRF